LEVAEVIYKDKYQSPLGQKRRLKSDILNLSADQLAQHQKIGLFTRRSVSLQLPVETCQNALVLSSTSISMV
jgi:hypothetical protein